MALIPYNTSTEITSTAHEYWFPDTGAATVDKWPWVRWTDTRVGWKDPSWRTKVANKTSATTPCTSTTIRLTRKSITDLTALASYNTIYPPYGYVLYSPRYVKSEVANVNLPFNLRDSNFRNQVLSKFYKKVRQAHTSFEGLAFLGELLETKRMIADTAFKLSRLVIRDGDRALSAVRSVRGAFAKKRVFTKLYLEYSYGWQPLIGDMNDLGEAFARNSQPNIVIRQKGVKPVAVITDDMLDSGIGPMVWRDRTFETTNVIYSFVVGLLPEWDQPSNFGLDLQSVPLAAWELTPYSFLIDYFVDIGDWLNFKTYCSLNPLYSTEVIIEQRKTVRQHLPPTAAAYKTACFVNSMLHQGGTYLDQTTTAHKFERLNLVGMPQMSGPAIAGLPNMRRILNIGALANQATRFFSL